MGSGSYDPDNNLTSGPASASFAYDPAGRLYQSVGAGVTTRFLHDGAQIAGEYDANGTLLRRYVPGPGLDEPVVWYEGPSVSDRRFLAADERGSVIALSDSAGAKLAINRYDEFGIPASGNLGRFGYAGAAWLPEALLYHMRARAYAPSTGRFMQSDPIGFAGGMNLYAYVGNDPMNRVDPFGLQELGQDVEDVITIPGTPVGCNWACEWWVLMFDCGRGWGFGAECNYLDPGGAGGGGVLGQDVEDEVVVTAQSTHVQWVPWVTARPPLVVRPRLGQRLGQPHPGPEVPRPPGWTSEWRWDYPNRTNPRVGPRWFDPRGGEWRYHPADRWHSRSHWDYNPWNHATSPWRNVEIPGLVIGSPEWDACVAAQECV